MCECALNFFVITHSSCQVGSPLVTSVETRIGGIAEGKCCHFSSPLVALSPVQQKFFFTEIDGARDDNLGILDTFMTLPKQSRYEPNPAIKSKAYAIKLDCIEQALQRKRTDRARHEHGLLLLCTAPNTTELYLHRGRKVGERSEARYIHVFVSLRLLTAR